MDYRVASASDAAEILRLRAAFLREDWGASGEASLRPVLDRLPDYFARHLGRDLIVFLAKEQEHAVSTVFLLVSEKPANPDAPNGLTGTLLNVYTEPACRRRGIARTLLEMALQEAARLGLSSVVLKATAMGAPLYRSVGFVESRSRYTPMQYELPRQ